jgi:hypothetical protein
MGWSVDTQQLVIERVFRKQKMKCKITHPEAPYPTVLIQYSGEKIRVDVMQSIVELFPEFVYVHFIPETVFPEDKPSGLGATLEPARSDATPTK